MNEYDSNRISDITKDIGYNRVDEIENAECFVINTCHIREKATEKVFHEIGRIKKRYNKKNKPIIIVTGCVAQAEGEIILKKEKLVNAVVGPQSYHKIDKIIKEFETKETKQSDVTEFNVIEKFDTLKNIVNSDSKISTFVTIQEGCDKFCKFCVVPYTRGAEISRPFNHIIEESKQLVKNGAKEITLLGQNVNAYNFEKKKLSDLIYKLEKIDGLLRIRYTTSHPTDMSDDLIKAHKKSKKLMPLLHLPVQSGSDKILKKMNRNHSIQFYKNILDKLKRANPKIKFSSDFIIGYPSETKEDFKKSLELLKDVGFIQTFSFLYSQRPGTPATNLDQVGIEEKRNRLREFQKLSELTKLNYRKKLLNKKVSVLVENKAKGIDQYFGRDEHLNSVVFKSSKNLIGKILDIKITEVNIQTLTGELDTFDIDQGFAA